MRSFALLAVPLAAIHVAIDAHAHSEKLLQTERREPADASTQTGTSVNRALLSEEPDDAEESVQDATTAAAYEGDDDDDDDSTSTTTDEPDEGTEPNGDDVADDSSPDGEQGALAQKWGMPSKPSMPSFKKPSFSKPSISKPSFKKPSFSNPFKKKDEIPAYGDCRGKWVEDNCPNCQKGTEKFQVTNRGGPEGKQCEAQENETRQVQCPCKKDCEGVWEDKGKCGEGGKTTVTQRFRVRKVANELGKDCEAKHGETREQPCGHSVAKSQATYHGPVSGPHGGSTLFGATLAVALGACAVV